MNARKLVAGILLASMTLSMVACSSSSDSSTKSTIAPSVEPTESNPYGLKGDGLYSCSDEPLTLTCFAHWQGNYVLTDNMPIPTEMARYTNITLDGVAPEYSNDSSQAFNLMMTDPVLPDIIGGEVVDINKYAAEGAFVPLNDLLEEYAPNITAVLDAYPEARASVTMDDGNIYAVPFVYEYIVSQGWFVRQDWLDTLGLEVPTTFDEFEAMLYAFRDGDPNGNGIADEVAYFRRKTADTNYIMPLLQLFGVNGYWHVNDGQVQIGTYHEDYKAAMQGISEWYDEGLIYQEIFTVDGGTRDLLYPDDNGGLTFDWMASTSAYNDSMPTFVDDFYLTAMAPPADVNDVVWTSYSRLRTEGFGWGISVDNENVIETIKFMDFLFCDQGRDVTTYGIEGETYYYNEEGDPIYMDHMFNGEESLVTLIFKMGGSLKPMAFFHDGTYEYQVMHDEGIVGTEIYSEIVNTHLPQLPTVSLTLEESDIISSIYPSCEAYILEKAESWTYNGDRIEGEFDDYMNTLSQMGMDEVVAVYQAAYDRMMESVAE
ncbi:MAG: extracellular solute-binding protein [Clostridia bacterium]